MLFAQSRLTASNSTPPSKGAAWCSVVIQVLTCLVQTVAARFGTATFCKEKHYGRNLAGYRSETEINAVITDVALMMSLAADIADVAERQFDVRS